MVTSLPEGPSQIMSAFTALNGGSSPKPSELPSITVANKPTEKTTAVDNSPSISPATRTHPDADISPRDKGERPAHGADRPAFPPITSTEVDATTKRKRSESPESRLDSSIRNRSPDVVVVLSLNEARHRYGTPQKEYRQYPESDSRDRESWQPAHGRDERSPYETQQNSATPTHANAEDQLGEALHRATMDHSDYANTSPDIEDRPHSLYGSYPPDHRQDSILQHDPKKRKRNFSNRTKTGCLTCRKRKKKCDEQKPECKRLFYLLIHTISSLFLLLFPFLTLFFSTTFLFEPLSMFVSSSSSSSSLALSDSASESASRY
jgi:hypothetical protein